MAPGVDAGDTAWMLAATALVLLMTPALGLFYAGLVRAKNTLNTFMMCIAALAVATITWALVGYSLAFSSGNGVIGGLDFAFLSGVAFAPRDGTKIPHLLFMAFQATFCIVTTALVAGAVVERMRFGAFLAFAALWSVLVYAVLAHWVWGGGWLQAQGTLDFAGGVPVEMGSGFSSGGGGSGGFGSSTSMISVIAAGATRFTTCALAVSARPTSAACATTAPAMPTNDAP